MRIRLFIEPNPRPGVSSFSTQFGSLLSRLPSTETHFRVNGRLVTITAHGPCLEFDTRPRSLPEDVRKAISHVQIVTTVRCKHGQTGTFRDGDNAGFIEKIPTDHPDGGYLRLTATGLDLGKLSQFMVKLYNSPGDLEEVADWIG
jgi:hypothetical protein